MKKKLLSLTLGCLALLTANAQEPILKWTFDASGPVLSGPAATLTDGTTKRTAKAISTNTAYTVSTYNAARDEYLGSTNVGSTTSATGNGFYYILFDEDDAFGEAMKGDFTAELLFRPESKNAISQTAKDKGSSNYTCKFLSCTQAGGWAIKYYPGPWDKDLTGTAGISTEYSVDVDGTNTYLNAIGGADNGNVETGKFYHIVAVFDKTNKQIRLYKDGKLLKLTQDDRMANKTNFPKTGTTLYQKGMALFMGGDPGSNASPVYTQAENSCRATFVFANFYNKALTDEEVEVRFADKQVQDYKAIKPIPNNMIWDVVPTATGVYDASSYHNLNTFGEITTQYNDTIKRYETVWDNNSANGVYREYATDNEIFDALQNGMAIEVYAKANSALPAASTSPLSFQQAGGIGFEFNTAGGLNFNYNQNGYLLSGGGAKNLSVKALAADGTNAGVLNTEYNHYVLVKGENHTYIYINGELNNQLSWVDGTDIYDHKLQSTVYCYGGYQWFCYGGDTKGNLHTAADFPWNGKIAIGRIWGKALNANDVKSLYEQATFTDNVVTIGNSGLKTVVFPFNVKVPAGIKVFVPVKDNGKTINVEQYAAPGDIIAAYTPVIVKGNAGDYEFTAEGATLENIKAAPATNLLKASILPVNVQNAYVLNGTTFEQVASVGNLTAWLEADDTISVKEIDLPKFKLEVVDGRGGKVVTTQGSKVLENKCDVTFESTVTLTVEPEEGVMFLGWTPGYELTLDGKELISRENPWDVFMEKDTVAVAQFGVYGDADLDYSTTVNDFNYVKHYVLELMPAPVAPSVKFLLADVNADNEINIADAQAVAAGINGLGGFDAKSFMQAETVAQGFNVAFNGNEMTVTLDNASAFSGAQFDVMLPEGVSISNLATDASHAIAANKLANGMTRVLVTSINVENFNNNEVATITLTSNADVTVANAIFADRNFNAVKATGMTVTGINGANTKANKDGKFIQNNKVQIQKNGIKYDVDGKLAK